MAKDNSHILVYTDTRDEKVSTIFCFNFDFVFSSSENSSVDTIHQPQKSMSSSIEIGIVRRYWAMLQQFRFISFFFLRLSTRFHLLLYFQAEKKFDVHFMRGAHIGDGN